MCLNGCLWHQFGRVRNVRSLCEMLMLAEAKQCMKWDAFWVTTNHLDIPRFLGISKGTKFCINVTQFVLVLSLINELKHDFQEFSHTCREK